MFTDYVTCPTHSLQWDHSHLWLWDIQNSPVPWATAQGGWAVLQTSQGPRANMETQSVPCEWSNDRQFDLVWISLSLSFPLFVPLSQNGHREDNGNYLSVFVELYDGFDRTTRYQYSIEMLYNCGNKHPHKNYRREYGELKLSSLF